MARYRFYKMTGRVTMTLVDDDGREIGERESGEVAFFAGQVDDLPTFIAEAVAAANAQHDEEQAALLPAPPKRSKATKPAPARKARGGRPRPARAAVGRGKVPAHGKPPADGPDGPE